MKKLLNGVALASLLLAAPAMAADLPARVAARPAPPIAVPMYNWSGFYIGGHAGYGFGDAEFNIGATTVTRDADGFVGGGHAGINWQMDRLVLGIEGSLSFLNTDESGPCALGAFTTCSHDLQHFWRAGGRLGFATGASGNWLIYGMGGFARAKFETTVAGTPGRLSNTEHHHGWYGGGGVEYGVTPNFVIGVEGYFASLGNETVGTGVFRRDIDLDFAVVQARASYKFNWFGSSPVVARY